MTYYFDDYGWLSATPIAGRETDTAPPEKTLQDGFDWNFTGYTWVELNKNQQVTQPTPTPDERLFWLDVGPFIDRLGVDGPAIGASTHPACKGVMAMLTGRKYIDLKDEKTAQMLDILILSQQPTAVPYFPGSGPITAEKKAVILNTATTEKERHIKGLQQNVTGIPA